MFFYECVYFITRAAVHLRLPYTAMTQCYVERLYYCFRKLIRVYKVRKFQNKKVVNVLQIKRLSMNSITLDYSFWVKVGRTFHNLLIGSNRVIVCSESSIVGSDVYRYFSSGPSPLCSSTRLLRPLLLNLSLLEVTS